MLRLFILFLTALSFGCELHGGIWNSIVDTFRGQSVSPPPTLRILIEHDVEKVKFEVTGKYSLYDPYTNSHISSRFVGKSREIEAINDGLKWGEAFPGIYQLKVVPDEAKTLTLVNGRVYTGSMYVYDIGGAISIVNQLPIESYISHVMANYSVKNLHPEVLAALAIVVRTNTYYMAENPKNTYWSVDAKQVAYQGEAPSSYEMTQAVSDTRYMIMSRTGIYDKVATPFAAQFEQVPGATVPPNAEISKISLNEANALAQKGEHAAQILAKAFPNTTIMLMHYSS